jgi:hypothetical protein
LFTEVIEGHDTHSLVVKPERGGHPWYSKWQPTVFLDFFMMGWIPRLLLDVNSLRVEFTIEKYIVG